MREVDPHDWFYSRWYAGEFPKVVPSTRIARMRRGKYVRIPSEWRGVVTYPQTIRKRKSKIPHKMRRSPYPHPTHVVKPKDSRTRQEIRADLTLAEETDMLSTMLTPYDIKQQALEIALAYVDHLIDNEKSIDQAIDHATHRFGVARSELRDMYFRRTNSLRPRITVASTPSVAVSP